MQEAALHVIWSCSKVSLHNKTNRYLNSRWLSNLLFAAWAKVMFSIYHIKGTFSSIKWKKKKKICAILLQPLCNRSVSCFWGRNVYQQQSRDPTQATRFISVETCKQRGQRWAHHRWMGLGWTLQPLASFTNLRGISTQKKETANLHYQVREALQWNLWQVNLNQIKANCCLYNKDPHGHGQGIECCSYNFS